jgi:ribosomal protein L14E/L6E/L27E
MQPGFWVMQAKLQAQRQNQAQQLQIIQPNSPSSSTPTSPKQKRRASLPNIKFEYVQRDLINQIIIQPKSQASLENKNYIRPQPTCLDKAMADILLAQFEKEKREKRAAQAASSAVVKRSASAPIASIFGLSTQAKPIVPSPCPFVFAHDGIILMQ